MGYSPWDYKELDTKLNAQGNCRSSPHGCQEQGSPASVQTVQLGGHKVLSKLKPWRVVNLLPLLTQEHVI